MKSEMGEDQEIVLVPSGTVLVEHTPSGKPFAPWRPGDDNGEPDKQGTEGDTTKFTARCLSDILRLVSPLLNTSLDRRWVGWKESGPDNQGIRHVELKGFDSVALHHVLNILHHQADLNPERLTVEGLAKMAVIVHHLGCHQAFVPVSKVWAADYQGLPKSGFSRDVVLWLLVSTVFAMRPIFDSAATMVIKEGTGPLDTLGLPIEERVVDKHRLDRIELLVQSLFAVVDKLFHGSGCTTDCDSFHLGALLIRMTQCKLYRRPSAPYDGISIYRICKMVEGYGAATGRFVIIEACHGHWEVKKACKVRSEVQRILETAKIEFSLGIELGRGGCKG